LLVSGQDEILRNLRLVRALIEEIALFVREIHPDKSNLTKFGKLEIARIPISLMDFVLRRLLISQRLKFERDNVETIDYMTVCVCVFVDLKKTYRAI
jgi:hypothetical protein